jgi:hypothetical protein
VRPVMLSDKHDDLGLASSCDTRYRLSAPSFIFFSCSHLRQV